MKAFWFILAIYTVALTAYPCSDPYTCKDELQNGEKVTSVTDHQHSDDEQDICTPFCICSCCAAHIRLASVSTINVAPVVHNTKEAIPYTEKKVLFDHNHIWQPPRI